MTTSEIPSPGDILAGKYRVQSVVGAGGMGIVLRVEHIELAQAMAIKLMMPGSAHDAVAVARFVREARAAAGLQSEHVVRIFDVGTADVGTPYIVMELLRGEDLAKVLASAGRLPVSSAVDYVLQACHAIAEAHASGIVHRDLKPSNLFLTQRSDGAGFIKVLDFGISKAVNEAERPLTANLTATSAVMGSPLYMSPEQVRNAKQVDARADIWSLGVILHELLTGAPAFQADTLPGICAAIIADEPPLLRSGCEEAPAGLEAVVRRCLEKNVAYRFQSVRELMAALRPFASGAMQSSVPSSPGSQTMPETGLSGRMSAPAASATLESMPAHSPRPSVSRGARASQQAVASSVPRPGHAASMAPADLVSSGAPVASSHADGRAPASTRFGVLLALIGLAAMGMVLLLRARPAPHGDPPVSSAALPSDSRAAFALQIESVPEGALVLEGEQVIGRTPMALSIDNAAAKRQPRRFTLQRDQFESYAIEQGASQDNVRVVAQLRPVLAAPTAPSPRPPPVSAHPVHGVAAAPAPSAALPVDAPAAPPGSAAPLAPIVPPAASADIRLQR